LFYFVLDKVFVPCYSRITVKRHGGLIES